MRDHFGLHIKRRKMDAEPLPRAEMDLSMLESAKLLKRMTVLEEHGGTFAKKTLLSLPVMGGFLAHSPLIRPIWHTVLL